jgi:hypothetical protein
MARTHQLMFGDLACLCDSEAQCRACQGRGKRPPPGFEEVSLSWDDFPWAERDAGAYTGQHRAWEPPT